MYSITVWRIELIFDSWQSVAEAVEQAKEWGANFGCENCESAGENLAFYLGIWGHGGISYSPPEKLGY